MWNGTGGALLVIEPDIYGRLCQLIKPFHDETECRALALAALDRLDGQFESVEEMWFTTEFRSESFAAFKEFMSGMSGMSFNDNVAERIEQAEVVAAFEAGRIDSGYRFTNPMRLRVHRGPLA